MAHGIVLLGANGCGKSMLGRELAHVLNFTHQGSATSWIPCSSSSIQASKDTILTFLERVDTMQPSGKGKIPVDAVLQNKNYNVITRSQSASELSRWATTMIVLS